MSIKRKKRERLSNLEQTSAWLGPLVQSEPSAQVVVAALMRHDCWQLSVQLGNILNSQSQRPAWGPEDQNQWDWPCPRSHSFTPVYTNITDAHECLPHRGQMLSFFSSKICFLRIDSDSLADVILFFFCFLLVLLLFLPLSGQRRRVSSDQPLLLWYTAAGKEKRYQCFFSADVFSIFGADKDSSALSLCRSLIFTFEEMNQALVGLHLRWSVLYSWQVSHRWNEERRILKLKYHIIFTKGSHASVCLQHQQKMCATH